MDITQRQSESVLWQQVWGIAVLQAAVALSWQIYSAAQPAILNKVGLMAALGMLSLVPGILSLLLDPLMGKFTDHIQRKIGARLPVVNVGVILTSLIFMTVALGLQTNLLISLKWFVPMMMVAWVATMKVFQNPSISLVKRYVPPQELPRAASLLTVLGAVVSATKPLAASAVARFGASLTFLLGGVVLMTALTILQRLTPKAAKSAAETGEPELTNGQLATIFVVGLGVQLAAGGLLGVMPGSLRARLPQLGFELISSSILIVSGISAIPVGQWIKRIGVERALLAGLGGALAVVSLALLSVNASVALGEMVVCGVVLALLFNVGVPFALARVPASQASFAIGLFFGGGGAATLFFTLFKLQYGELSPWLAWWMSLIAFGLVVACLEVVRRGSLAWPGDG